MTGEKIFDLTFDYAGKREKRVRVYVPAHEDGETFPVIYMTDGQNLFEDDTVEFGCWYTREAVRAERDATGKAAIIVGVFNTDGPKKRAEELTPKSIGPLALPPEMPQEERMSFSPEGEIFDDFVVNTVMPAVEERFPVKKGRAYTAFCGSSSGGLQAFYTALVHPDLFCASGVFSPAFMYYMPQDISAWIHTMLRPEMPYLYMYSGGGDPLEQFISQVTDFVYNALLECYPPEKLNEVILPDEMHNEKAWAEIFKDFLHTFLTRGEEF